MTGTNYVCAPTPPPDLDDLAWRESIVKLKATGVRRLYLTHFGQYDDAPRMLDATIESLDQFLALGGQSFNEGVDQETLTAAIHAKMSEGIGPVPDGILENLEWSTPAYMAALGLTRYFTKKASPSR